MSARRIAVISAGLSEPSSTRQLADALARASAAELARGGEHAAIEVIELRHIAPDILNGLLTGTHAEPLVHALRVVEEADAVIAVTPIFSTSYSGLFKMFVDLIDRDALTGVPVILGATAGTPRHSLAIDYAMRPLFSYLHADVVPTGVFAATADWGGQGTDAEGLPGRIARAAGELAGRLTGTAPRTRAPRPEAAPTASAAPAAAPLGGASSRAFDGGFVPLGDLLPH
ncbi:hypothetical protein D9V32_11740 [Mycetocola tolaasinivorans]|uniref:NADPH-dependent FMN reductase-like domain-containing protein n=1 Tax=Mycetocola tolaasinivorans TaxID=76635 RepID=A0A3L7A3S9_9MICO|nr:CE1759 family FMN reductase [Mycetocola tolaasinivorans]RLP74705.1 hypothetical protein D9V32_11740 [Mycetocola tolaasinivorans]